ncbi:MAG: NmrA family NAD(P)-binding protein, partial [Marmoricola sp.]
ADVVVSAVHGFTGTRGVSPATVDRDGNVNLVDAAKASGADVVLMSVVGAAPDSPMELFAMKYAAERYLFDSGVPATVVRSTAFLELWLGLLRQTAGRSGRPLVFGRGRNPINFVSVADVAALVERVVIDPATRGQTLEIGGPENVTFDDLAARVTAASGGTGRPRHVPTPALRGMSATLGRLRPDLGRMARAALAMDSIDMTFDSAASATGFPDLPCTPLAEVLHR